MKIILDAFGGDNAPAEALKGRSMAVKELGVTVLAVGDIEKMQECWDFRWEKCIFVLERRD